MDASWPGPGRRPVARMTSRVRVTTARVSSLASDVPVMISPDDPGEIFVEPYGEGRVVVPGEDGVVAWATRAPGEPSPTVADVVEVVVDGWRFELEVEADARARSANGRRGRARPPPAGRSRCGRRSPAASWGSSVGDGDAVEAGQTVLVVEAMKMQNEIQAPRAGRRAGRRRARDTIELGASWW